MEIRLARRLPANVAVRRLILTAPPAARAAMAVRGLSVVMMYSLSKVDCGRAGQGFGRVRWAGLSSHRDQQGDVLHDILRRRPGVQIILLKVDGSSITNLV